MNDTPIRFLVEWHETASYTDIAYVDPAHLRQRLSVDEDEWAAMTNDERVAYARIYLNECRDVADLGGTQRWRRVGTSGFDVTMSKAWPDGTEEPAL